MSKAALTIRAFGYYLIVLGVALVTVPNLLLGVFLSKRPLRAVLPAPASSGSERLGQG